MSNPKVQPYLHFYSKDADTFLKHTYQASCWLHEMDPDLLMPVVQQGQQQFFVFEPSILVTGTVAMPVHWFICDGKMFVQAWLLQHQCWEGKNGWVVYEFEEFKTKATSFIVSFPFFCDSYRYWNIPNPCHIIGVSSL